MAQGMIYGVLYELGNEFQVRVLGVHKTIISKFILKK
jgi:hypothetical protein